MFGEVWEEKKYNINHLNDIKHDRYHTNGVKHDLYQTNGMKHQCKSM